jgi:hypothetical protein
MRVRQLCSVFATLILCLIVLALCTAPMWAQSTSTGTIAGTVTDPSGAVVNGATVTLTDTGTKSARQATTNDAGRYIFVDVPPGAYDLSIAKQGFSTTKTQVTVTVGVATTLNLSLQVGGSNVVVEVTAVGTELQTMNATVGNTVTSIALDNLPMIGRDVNTFIELQPGVSAGGDVAGAVNDQSYFSLDGGNNSNDMDGSGGVYTATQQNLVIGDTTGGMANPIGASYSSPSGVMPTPADSVEEFKVNTAGQTADFNSSAGAEIKVVTKRGTSAFHGTAYEYYKDNNWSSNSWANNQNNWWSPANGNCPSTTPNCGHIGLPAYHYSRFGGAVGGPLIPKEVLGGKTFFFFNYEGFRYPNAETITRNVPSPALQLGLLTDASTGQIAYNLNNHAVPPPGGGNPIPANFGCSKAPGGLCDPLGLGINPLVSQIWSKYAPASNATCSLSLCDNANVLGFAGNLNVPITSKFMVGRIDHDFSSKQHFMVSYRYYKIKVAGDEEVDIGGFFPGDKKGTPASASSDPVQDWYLVAGLTTNITNNTTNDFHFSHLRNWWAWSRNGAPPQIAGLGGALELDGGQTQTQDLAPFNTDNQQIRRRFWDGMDNMFRDDVSMLKGNHLFQFGGTYQRNFNYHQRNDSGGTINAFPVYSLGDGGSGALVGPHSYPCATTPTISTKVTTCDSLVATDLGVVSIASQMFARAGASLNLQPPLSNAFDKSHIPYYNVYFADTWHMKPTFTLTYGLGWALEMPPVEEAGKQSELVDLANQPISTTAYLASTRKAALAGQVFNPIMGFDLVGNTANGLKYPYNPFYGEFSPRVAFAWSPKATTGAFGNTVVRFGYGRSYGRTNGVVQVLVPLLGLGLEQPVPCRSNLVGVVGPAAWSCTPGAGTWSNAFRVGQTASATGGPSIPLASLASPTLPQPVYPGINNAFSGTPEGLDPNFRASAIDSFDVTVQKQLNRRITLELGYIYRRITHEYQPIELNPVPYMMTLGGQQFKNAYANAVMQYCGGFQGLAGGGCALNAGAVTAQPFFEAALKGTGYCSGYVNCTQAVVANEGGAGGNLANAQVWGLWSDLDSGCPAVVAGTTPAGYTGCTTSANGTTSAGGGVGAFNFPRTLQSTPVPSTCNATNTIGCTGQYTSGAYQNASIGYGNYNAGFVSVKIADWHGWNAQSNFTWSKALGTGAQAQSSSVLTAIDPFNLSEQYGRQPWDRKFLFNTYFVYSPPFYKGQSGILGRVLGGWTFASIFAAGSGVPVQLGSTFGNFQQFGACDGVGCGDYNMDNAVPIGSIPHVHANYCPGNTLNTGSCKGITTGYPVNYFQNPTAQVMNWRNPILGIDTRDGGSGILSGLAYWNMDFSIKKNIRVAESVSLEFQGVFANVFNHMQWTDNYLGLYGPSSFGGLGYSGGQFSGEAEPRNIEVGVRVRF